MPDSDWQYTDTWLVTSLNMELTAGTDFAVLKSDKRWTLHPTPCGCVG